MKKKLKLKNKKELKDCYTSIMPHKSCSVSGRLVERWRRGKEYQKERREKMLLVSIGNFFVSFILYSLIIIIIIVVKYYEVEERKRNSIMCHEKTPFSFISLVCLLEIPSLHPCSRNIFRGGLIITFFLLISLFLLLYVYFSFSLLLPSTREPIKCHCEEYVSFARIFNL